MTNLVTELENFRAAMASKIPAEVATVMRSAGQKIAETGAGKNAPKIEDIAPDFVLPDAQGKSLRLSDLYSVGPVVLVFYRGGWCPFCNMELKAYQRELTNFKKAGIRIIAVSPERPDHTSTTQEKNALEFDVLSDTENQAARAYGLLFDLPSELVPVYKSFGVDLVNHNSVGAWTLPVPGTFAIAKGGIIRLAFADVDYTNRLEPADCLKALSV